MMNPQVLIDAVAHGVRGMIVVFDNRPWPRSPASEAAQYGRDFRTHDGVTVDYAQLCSAVKACARCTGVRRVRPWLRH